MIQMKKHKPLKRVLALVLSCIMVLSLLPGAAFAASDSVSIRFKPNYDSPRTPSAPGLR